MVPIRQARGLPAGLVLSPTSGFLQIPPQDGHPCLRLYPSHYRADSGLSPIRKGNHNFYCDSPFKLHLELHIVYSILHSIAKVFNKTPIYFPSLALIPYNYLLSVAINAICPLITLLHNYKFIL